MIMTMANKAIILRRFIFNCHGGVVGGDATEQVLLVVAGFPVVFHPEHDQTLIHATYIVTGPSVG